MFITVFAAVHFGIPYATLDTYGLDLVKNKIFWNSLWCIKMLVDSSLGFGALSETSLSLELSELCVLLQSKWIELVCDA